MKVLYLFCDGTRSEGVISKVRSKIKGLNQAGIYTKGLFITPGLVKEEFNEEENVRYSPFVYHPLPSIYNRRYIRNYIWYFNYNNYIKQLYTKIDSELSKEEFDLILFRYPLANKYLVKLSERFKNKIVFEHNTIEPSEIASGGLINKETRLIYNYEKKYAPVVLRNAKAIIGVTHEITDYETRRSDKRIKGATITNGVASDKIVLRTPSCFNGKELKLLMLCGSVVNWHGEDIIMKAIADYQGDCNVSFYILGDVSDSSKKLAYDLGIESKVHFIPQLKWKELDEMFDKVHVGIGTMALFRKGLKQATPLKVREYMLRGLPFIINYDDPDLIENPAMKNYYYQTQQENISIEEIIHFAGKVFGIDNHAKKMRSEAIKIVDVNVKMKTLAEFLRSLK